MSVLDVGHRFAMNALRRFKIEAIHVQRNARENLKLFNLIKLYLFLLRCWSRHNSDVMFLIVIKLIFIRML